MNSPTNAIPERSHFRPTNLFVHTDIYTMDIEEARNGNSHANGLEEEDDIHHEPEADPSRDTAEEEEDPGYCWRNFWCYCWLRRKRRARLDGQKRKRETDYGVLIIVVGLAVFSIFYFFSRTSVYRIVPLQ